MPERFGPDVEESYGPTTPWQRRTEEQRLHLEGRLKEAIEAGASPATISRYRNQLGKLPPVYQDMRDYLIRIRERSASEQRSPGKGKH